MMVLHHLIWFFRPEHYFYANEAIARPWAASPEGLTLIHYIALAENKTTPVAGGVALYVLRALP
jgi:hypothetical protein